MDIVILNTVYIRAILTLSLMLCTSLALAQNYTRGPVTNLPIPRFVSLKASEGNIRRGPSLSHRIDWVLKHRNMPLQVIAEYGHWRKVQDFEGAGGWIHYSLLSGTRSILVQVDMLDVLNRPKPNAQIRARLERNVVARLSTCTKEWCEITADGHKGWVNRRLLWGVTLEEKFE